jgi:hypothetical protein
MLEVSGNPLSHPLQDVSGLRADWLEVLRGHWLTTAEEVLAVAASPAGREGLRQMLASDERALASFLGELEAVVGAEMAQRLRKPASPHAKGAWLTEEQKDRFGLEKGSGFGVPGSANTNRNPKP